MPPVRFDKTRLEPGDITQLHNALGKLNLQIDPEERASAEAGRSTKAAIAEFQEKAGLSATGNLNKETLKRLNANLEHRFYTDSKPRTAKIQAMLERTGYEIDPQEKSTRRFGQATEAALHRYLGDTGLGTDAELSAELIGRLEQDALASRLQSKTQIGNLQHTILKALRVASLQDTIATEELKAKKLGDTSTAAIKSFQEKYGLEVTGQLDTITLNRIETVAKSRKPPARMVEVKTAVELTPIQRNLRLNMTNKHVAGLQKSLAFLGYPVAEKEFKTSYFGGTTRTAVIEFQKKHGLPVDGHASGETLRLLNTQITTTNPVSELPALRHLRGSFRAENWQGVAGLRVQVWEKLVRGTGAKLAEKATGGDGFYDIPYSPPTDSINGQPKLPYHLKVVVVDAGGNELDSKVLFNPTPIAWVNFVQGDIPYKGDSEFSLRMASVRKVIGNLALLDLEETEDSQEITHVSVNSGLSIDDVMRLVLSARVAATIGSATIDTAAVYAFIRQNLPAVLPSDLLDSTVEWTMIDHLVERVANGLVFMEPELHEESFLNASQENYIPIEVGLRKQAILAEFARLRNMWALQKPILLGNGNLQALLDASTIPPARYPEVATAFLKHGSLGEDFWKDVSSDPAKYGGDAAIADFEVSVGLGELTRNFTHLSDHLRTILTDAGNPMASAPRDFAKLDQADWEQVIADSGGNVPDGTDGATAAERIQIYAATLKSFSERIYPTVAFVAEASRAGVPNFDHLTEIETLVDTHAEFSLASTNIDAYVASNNLPLDDDTRAELRALQRVHRISPNVSIGKTLLKNKIYSAADVVKMGREQVVARLKEEGLDQKTALTIYNVAEFQYGQAIGTMLNLRSEVNNVSPAAIVPYTYTTEELAELSGGVPNLEELFGSMDVSDSAGCDSVIGAPAYLVDILRFLNEHPSEIAGKSVRDQLFARRPDIGNLKLNCDNTNIPLPYIDLVNETLEALVPPADANTSYQTTLTQEELRAFPEYVRTEAYDVLKSANYPIGPTFNLWQEEARAFLNHLGVPRHELMKTFQRNGAPLKPTDEDIAAEFFGISTHEADIITTSRATDVDQKKYWNLDPVAAPMPVSLFLERSNLSYAELLRLLYVQWLNPSGAVDRTIINRPVDTSSLSAQTIENLPAARLDKMHRFLRLWRHTGWEMWELDLLLRAVKIGNGDITGVTLVRLMHVRSLQTRLGVDASTILALMGDISVDDREVPENPQKNVPSYYTLLFQNRLVTNPIDPVFELPIAAGALLDDHRPALTATLGITSAALSPIIGRTDGTLNLDNLAVLVGYATLAHALHLQPSELMVLLDLVDVSNPFSSLETTLQLVDHAETIRLSKLTISELDFLLNHRTASPLGLRESVISQELSSVRESVRSNPASDQQGQVIATLALSLSMTDEAASKLLKTLTLGGQPLIDAFLDPAYIASQGQGVDPVTFPLLYQGYRLLHKVSMVTQRMGIVDPGELDWLLARGAAVGVLPLNDLPVEAAPAASLYPQWLALNRFVSFREKYGTGEGSGFTDLLTLALNAASPGDSVIAALSRFTGWSEPDLKALHTGLGLKHGATSSYRSMETYLRLEKCLRMLKRVGVGAVQVLGWADRNAAQVATAMQVRSAAKAQFSETAWLEVATTLMDDLRERKRDALVAWLIENSLRNEPASITVNGKQWPNSKRWSTANELLAWVLIDVGMSSCQLTSRIKQAISSTQMYVQRCFLNLEQATVQVSRASLADTVSLNSWRQWKWMKNYRIWEANRKIFLYPENWLEPELRDGKSPFFDELESELLQADITDEKAVNAFRHYLEKVHEVAQLEVTGVYYDVHDDTPYDNLPPNINRLHVIGRTRSDPSVYFYRMFDLNYSTWTPWERMDIEIQGDHVIPVVYNRTLYVFWLVFLEKPQKQRKQPAAKATSGPTDAPNPSNQLEIQLAWSMQTDDGWTAKKVSRQKIIHPWQRPLHSYNLRPRYRSNENLLWLDLYISTSFEFNNGYFTDPFTDVRTRLTATGYSEILRPWHASSFIFDGNVIGTRMKGLTGYYRLRGQTGEISGSRSHTDSYTWVSTTFGPDAAATQRAIGGRETMPRLALPAGMHYENTKLRNNTQVPNPTKLRVLEGAASPTLLAEAKTPFALIHSQHMLQFDTATTFPAPMIYQDPQRSFFILPWWRTTVNVYNSTSRRLKYDFHAFYHPYSALFLRELKRSGLGGLFNRNIQLKAETYQPQSQFDFVASYSPESPALVHTSARSDIVDFGFSSAYSIYNWELFFHAPLMVATRLSQNQRFEEALNWFHYIFDPTNTQSVASPQRFWVTKPFYEQNSEAYRKQRIEDLLQNIGANMDQLRAWKNNPFMPHVIARYRPVAYQRNVVMKYIDNLIAWGDQLFRRDTIESINEATTLYLLAWEILGPRPTTVPNVARKDRTYNELIAGGALDPFGNASVQILMENFADSPIHVVRSSDNAEPMPQLEVQYFQLPQNSDLLAYWALVEERLFNIRHCMNIRGIVRQLPLFEPPIDPALLVQAAAAGVDLGSVLGEVASPIGQYRFRILVQKAIEFSQDVRSLGDRILSAIEKSDAAELELIRASNEVAMLGRVKDVRQQQIKEAEQNLLAAERQKTMAETRQEYYGSREFTNAAESTALALSGVSALAQAGMALGYSLAAGLTFIPRFTVGGAGFGGSPTVVADPVDGARISKAAEYAVSTVQALIALLDKNAGMATTVGSYQRRAEDWDFQERIAQGELSHSEPLIAAAGIRKSLAEIELANHEFQVEQAEGVQDYLTSKYTNQQLYTWMLKQASTVYFQCYQLAYEMAKRAESSLRFELGSDSLSFIQFGYWDGLKKGLMAGDRLLNDLRRMESFWYENNQRTFEISKNISLAQIDPLALLKLKTTGTCSVTLPEWLFDQDYPGHYRRRMASVSISIPCVVGPYTSVNCTLSLTNNGIRVKDDMTGGYGDALTGGDDRFVKESIPIEMIATSHAQNDGGLFQLNFSDDRFLPFEGAGAVSQWTIDLPLENNQFDFASISDVILHVRYTALKGSTALANGARANLATIVPEAGVRMFIVNREFVSEWAQFLMPQPGGDQELVLPLERKHLPFRARGAQTVRITRVDLIAESDRSDAFDVSLTLPGAAAGVHVMTRIGGGQNPHHLILDPIAPPTSFAGELKLKIKKDDVPDYKSLKPEDLGDVWLIVRYKTT